ncbi:MAG: hypothetical protein MI975_08045 [Cytophagales bacterium]|nr:hypothetical protein [Cytophagales bacterium]
MESNINHQVIESYAKSYADLVIKNFFEKETSIKGGEISSFSEINQINYFVFKILFEKWKSEFDNLKSPYFNYEAVEVKKAAQSFMNVLSKNIRIKKEDFRPLLEEAVYKTLLLIFSPYEYYLQEINHPGHQKISINDLHTIHKYIKINGHLLTAYIDRFHSDGIQEVFNDDAVRIFDEVCETIKETPEDFERYQEEFSKLIDLNLEEVYSPSGEIVKEIPENDGEPDNLNEKFKSEQQTLLDTLDVNHEDALIDIHEKKPLDGIKKSITINQRFMFENDLFNGDKSEFEMVINYLDNCKTNQEAMEFINENYAEKKNWDMEKEEVIEFLEVIKRRFPE